MEEASTSQQVIVASPRATFSTLPTELHLQIASYLTYPDALSLKHTNRHLYGIVYTGVNLKVEWLIERRTLHLDCPHDKKCELGSDMRFCRGSVRLVFQAGVLFKVLTDQKQVIDEETEGAWRM